METKFSVDQLAEQVNAWCEEHGVVPASGQVGLRITERNIRFYRALGLLDPPAEGGGLGYGEKHRLQLCALRLLQAQGLPLNRIQPLLFGRTVEDLRQIEQEGLAEMAAAPVAAFRPALQETWRVTPLDDEFVLVSRRGRGISAELRERLLSMLNGSATHRRRSDGARKEQ